MNSEINIPDHWQLATIKDVQANEKRATITGPFGSSIGKRFFVSEGIPVIRGNNLSYKVGTFDDSGFVYITREKANELKGYIAKPGDLIFTAAGTIGQVALIPFAARFEEYIISNKQMRVRLDPTKVDTFYAYYWFSCQIMNAYIKRQNTGSTIPLINLSVLRSLPIPLPPLQEQRMIATILKSLDDKIGINYQINQTLEQMAQTIFKSWFVDFEPVKAKIAALKAGGSEEDALLAAMQTISGKDEVQLTRLQAEQPGQYAELRATAELFPSAMQDSEFGEIPEGWNPSTVGHEFDVTMGQSPPGNTYNEEGDGAPFFQGRRDFGERFPSNRVYCSAPKRMANKGDTLLSVRAPVGDTNIALMNCCIGRGLAALRHKSGCSSYTYYSIIQLGQALSSYDSEGTVFGSINQKNLRAIPVVAPAPDALAAFKRAVGPIDDLIKVNSDEAATLCDIRGALLPKLLSGELSVSAAGGQLAKQEEATNV